MVAAWAILVRAADAAEKGRGKVKTRMKREEKRREEKREERQRRREDEERTRREEKGVEWQDSARG